MNTIAADSRTHRKPAAEIFGTGFKFTLSVRRKSNKYHSAAQAPKEKPLTRSTLNSSIMIGMTAMRSIYPGRNKKTGAANGSRQDSSVQKNKNAYAMLMSGTKTRFKKKLMPET